MGRRHGLAVDGVRRRRSGPSPGPRADARWRSPVSVVLLIVGLLVGPVAVLAAWASLEVYDADRFVATFEPLGRNPDVQAYLTDKVVDAVDQAVHLDDLTQQVFTALTQPLGPVASDAAKQLEPAAAEGLRSMISSAVSSVTSSDDFPEVWDTVLRSTHQQATALLTGSGGSAVSAEGDTVVLNVGPLLARVQAELRAKGFPLTQLIPTGDYDITLATLPSLPTAQAWYRLMGVAGWLLPIVAVLTLVAAVLIARRRDVALAVAGAGVLVGMLAVLVALHVLDGVLARALGAPATVSAAIFDALVSFLVPVVTALAVVGAVALVAGLLLMPIRLCVAARGGFRDLVGTVQGHGIDAGVLSEPFLERMHRYRAVGWVTLGLAAALVIAGLRPVTPGVVFGTLVVAGLGAVLYAILQRAPTAPPRRTHPETTRFG